MRHGQKMGGFVFFFACWVIAENTHTNMSIQLNQQHGQNKMFTKVEKKVLPQSDTLWTRKRHLISCWCWQALGCLLWVLVLWMLKLGAVITWFSTTWYCIQYCSDWCRILNSQKKSYLQISNISHTLVGNEIVDHSDIVGASTISTAPMTSSFST